MVASSRIESALSHRIERGTEHRGLLFGPLRGPLRHFRAYFLLRGGRGGRESPAVRQCRELLRRARARHLSRLLSSPRCVSPRVDALRGSHGALGALELFVRRPGRRVAGVQLDGALEEIPRLRPVAEARLRSEVNNFEK